VIIDNFNEQKKKISIHSLTFSSIFNNKSFFH
jgi:hypothetical protein